MALVQVFHAATESDKEPVRVRSEDQIAAKIGADATKTNQLQSHVLEIPDGGPGAIPSDNNPAIKVEQNKLSSSVPIAAANGEARAVPTYDRGFIELGPKLLEAIAASLKTDKDKTDEEDERKKLHDLGFSVFIALSGLAISIFVALKKEFSKNENQLDVIPLLILFAQVLALTLILSSKIPGVDIEFLQVLWFTILASAGMAITGFTGYLLLKFWIFVAVASAIFVVIILFLAVRIWKKMRSCGRTPKGKMISSTNER